MPKWRNFTKSGHTGDEGKVEIERMEQREERERYVWCEQKQIRIRITEDIPMSSNQVCLPINGYANDEHKYLPRWAKYLWQ